MEPEPRASSSKHRSWDSVRAFGGNPIGAQQRRLRNRRRLFVPRPNWPRSAGLNAGDCMNGLLLAVLLAASAALGIAVALGRLGGLIGRAARRMGGRQSSGTEHGRGQSENHGQFEGLHDLSAFCCVCAQDGQGTDRVAWCKVTHKTGFTATIPVQIRSFLALRKPDAGTPTNRRRSLQTIDKCLSENGEMFCLGAKDSGGTHRRGSAPPLTALPNPEFPSPRPPHFQTGSKKIADSPDAHPSPTLHPSWKGGGSLAAQVAGGKSELHRARSRVTSVRPEIHAGGHDVRRGRQTVPQRRYRPGRKVRVRVKRRFKRPPLATQEAGHGKPPREQDQIGNLRCGPHRIGESRSDSGYRSLREMTLSLAQARKTEFGLQPFQDTILSPQPWGHCRRSDPDHGDA